MTDAPYATLLQQYVTRQVENLFPSPDQPQQIVQEHVDLAIERTNHCVSFIKAFNGRRFDHLNSGHYATFLYYLSNVIWQRTGTPETATRIFLLNKALNGIDLFYEVEMPDVFLIGHTVAMVFAKATYGSHCIFHQGCTVGRNALARPTLESGVILYPHSSVIGQCLVRENTVISPGVQLINTDTPGNCFVFPGERGKPVFKEISEYYADRYLLRG